jgi:4-amino-4-deoxy-L-arabinose transferase-like glycosyltransferase
LLKRLSSPPVLVAAALLSIWCVGMFARGYWTPDEPREADLAWRMSWQADKAVPLLAGEAFCEKPPLTYWLAALPMRLFGAAAWSARLPNLLYALLGALAVGLLARRGTGWRAGVVGAAAMSTFLLSYQVAIWLATDAPLLAAVAVALWGAYQGFYALSTRARLGGYSLMHAALGLGFLSKSAAAWIVPATAILTLAIWEKRWRELLRWELYAGLALQAAMIFTWIWFVYAGPDGTAHLKVFFWNNLVGRFTRVDAPSALQYAAAHRNFPGKYLIELPLYLFPWTLLVGAALRRAWQRRGIAFDEYRPVRFALAASLPALAILSLAATARNVYVAPALPGVALLLAWWSQDIAAGADRWDQRALRATAALLLLAMLVSSGALIWVAVQAWDSRSPRAAFIVISAFGLLAAAWLALRGWAAARDQAQRALGSLFLAYCVLLVGPASQAYRQVDTWQDLASIGRAIEHDAAGKPLILFAPDETTRAVIDMYARTQVALISGPIDTTAIERLETALRAAPDAQVVVQLHVPAAPVWAAEARLRLAKSYALPNGRRYALLERQP